VGDAATTWTVLYPSITVVSWLLTPSTAALPLPVRTLATTAIVVPLMTFVLMPGAVRLRTTLVRGKPPRTSSGDSAPQ
jgi:antibiotic biosynthesis monooxygenase (ABM) superfamily enzyme